MAEVQIIEKVKGRIDRSNGTIINGPIRVAAYARFARNTVDTLSYVRQLKEKNVAILFEEGKLNTLDIEYKVGISDIEQL